MGNNISTLVLVLVVHKKTEVSECSLSFGAESFAFQFVTQKFNDSDIQNYNFAICFYGCETWSLTLREERRLGMFED